MSVEVGIEEVIVEVTAPVFEIDVNVVRPIVEVFPTTSTMQIDVVHPVVDVSVIAAQVVVDVVHPVIEVGVNANTGGVTDHNELTGLGADDHPQYLTQQRGDLRYAALMQKVDFPIPSTVWVIDIGKPCHVVIYDSTKRVVEPGTIIESGNTELTLIFSASFSGVAYCYN